MTFHVQTDSEGRITDIIEQPFNGYIQIEYTPPLPVGVLGGAHQLVNGEIVYRADWDIKTDIQQLRSDVDTLLVAQLTAEGVL
jgi:hypothetical protein